MNILFLSSNIPSVERDSVRRVTFELLKFFSDFENVYFQAILDFNEEASLTSQESRDLEFVEKFGVYNLPVIHSSAEKDLVEARNKLNSFAYKILPYKPEMIYPWVLLENRIKKLVLH